MFEVTTNHTNPISPVALPNNRSRWPFEAKRAFHETLAELNAWDRDHEHQSNLNAWIAEQAVREAWAEDRLEANLKVA